MEFNVNDILSADSASGVEGWQKILSNQPFNAALFEADGRPVERAIYETILDVCGLTAPTGKFRLEQSDMFSSEVMASSPVSLGFLQWVIALKGCRRILEIGTFIGVSALYFAEAMADGGKVVSIEKFDRFADIARRNIAANGYAEAIDLLVGDAMQVMPDAVARGPFDLVFIDGNKERYADYLDAVTDHVAPGGIVVIDDALFHGDVMNEAVKSDKGRGGHAALERARALSDWRKTLLPMSNGMLLMTKPFA